MLSTRSALGLSLALFIAIPTFASAQASRYELLSVTRISDAGGRLDWAPDGSHIVYDAVDPNGLYDLFTMAPDGSDPQPLRCADPSIDEGLTVGQPAFHPNGEWIVFQGEKREHAGRGSASPGKGTYQDLYAMRLADRACFQLTDVSDGLGDGAPTGGSLHPVFSHDGSRLLWTDMEDYCAGCGLFGDWRLVVADLSFDADGTPTLRDHRYLDPGENGHWYESHGFGPDDTWIYFSGNTAGTWELYADINVMPLDDASAFRRLTRTAGRKRSEGGAYDEHAHFSRHFDAFAWLSDRDGVSEIWLADRNGVDARRLTHFNEEGHSHHSLVRGLRSVPSDNAWNPAPPEGHEELALYVQVGWAPLSNQSTHEEIYLLDFSRRPSAGTEPSVDSAIPAPPPVIPGEPDPLGAEGRGCAAAGSPVGPPLWAGFTLALLVASCGRRHRRGASRRGGLRRVPRSPT